MIDVYKIPRRLENFPKHKLFDSFQMVLGKRRIYAFTSDHLVFSIQFNPENKEVQRLFILHNLYNFSLDHVMHKYKYKIVDNTVLIGEKTQYWKEDYNEI